MLALLRHSPMAIHKTPLPVMLLSNQPQSPRDRVLPQVPCPVFAMALSLISSIHNNS